MNEKRQVNQCEHQNESDVKILDKDFKTAIIKMFPQTTTNSLETKGKKKQKNLSKK